MFMLSSFFLWCVLVYEGNQSKDTFLKEILRRSSIEIETLHLKKSITRNGQKILNENNLNHSKIS